jgi:transposase
MKTFFGVDYHKRFSYGVIMNEQRQILKHGRFDNSLSAVGEFLGGHAGDDCSAVLEATRCWCVMHDWLEGLAGEVTLAHPKRLRAIAEAAIKTDKIDATTLADLLRCDLIPRAHVASPEARLVKRLLRHRMFLVRVATMAKNRIHDLLDRHPGQRAEWQADELFTKKGVRWMRSLPLDEVDRHILHSELDLLDHLGGQIAQTDELLAKVGQADPRVARLDTAPGIGRYTAMLLVSEIDDIARFSSAEKLHAYAGLIPSTHASGGKVYHGRIIKDSNKYLRWALIEAVTAATRKEPQLNRFYCRLARKKGSNTARVATARRLLTIIYRMWREERDYRVSNQRTDRSSADLVNA